MHIIKKCFCYSLFFAYSTGLFGQWEDRFDQGNFSEWLGDVSQFVVNPSGQLQLNADDSGSSFIYRPSTIDADTISLFFDVQMDFAPSNNNNTRIYLALDSTDPESASGYFIQMGENGSDDAMEFYYLNEGSETLMASATMGAIASEPVQVSCRIDIYPDGIWDVYTQYGDQPFKEPDLLFTDQQFNWSESQYYGLLCSYSASRSDLFYFDNLGVQSFIYDTNPPFLAGIEDINENGCVIQFSEPVDINTATITLSPGEEAVTNIQSLDGFRTRFQLLWNTTLNNTETYILAIGGVLDDNDNSIRDTTLAFVYPRDPMLGDLLLSEVLFDPFPSGEDFIEIYNHSEAYLNIKDLLILNVDNDDDSVIETGFVLNPKAYLAVSNDVTALIQIYKPPMEAQMIENDLPAMNNDEGVVLLINKSGLVLDSFPYQEGYHFPLIDDTEGVSLERISFDVAADQPSNWTSAAESVRFATPGYQNSVSLQLSIDNGQIDLASESFSPNFDGIEDQLIVTYNLEKPGYVANLDIYDDSGFKIKAIAENELLGTVGFFAWDGTNLDQQIERVGLYIVQGELFHPDGDVVPFKKAFALVGKIE